MKVFAFICLGAVLALAAPVMAFGYVLIILSLATYIP